MPLVRRTAEDLDRERAEQTARVELRRRERLKAHAIAGAILFGGAQLVYGLITFAGPNLLGILLLAPFGAVLGLLATSRAWSMPESALAGFGMVGAFLGILAWAGGASGLAVPWIIVGAATSGGIPGCLVGFHVANAT